MFLLYKTIHSFVQGEYNIRWMILKTLRIHINKPELHLKIPKYFPKLLC